MTIKDINEAKEELRKIEIERLMELIGNYNSKEEDKILELS